MWNCSCPIRRHGILAGWTLRVICVMLLCYLLMKAWAVYRRSFASSPCLLYYDIRSEVYIRISRNFYDNTLVLTVCDLLRIGESILKGSVFWSVYVNNTANNEELHIVANRWNMSMGVLTRTAEVIGDKPVPAPLCLPQILHSLDWYRTRVSAVRVLSWERYPIISGFVPERVFSVYYVVSGVPLALFTA